MREDGFIMLVRKRGAASFMQAGSKIATGEKPAQALRRALREALNFIPSTTTHIGRFHAAGLLPEQTVEAELFGVMATNSLRAGADIEEIAWLNPAWPNSLALAPLTRDVVLPLIERAARPPAEAPAKIRRKWFFF